MIHQFNEKGHPMVFGEESVNTDHLIQKCRAAIASLTHQHGMAERLAEACFMIALSELENNWKQHAESALAEVQHLNATAQPVSDGCKWNYDDEGYWESSCGSTWVFNDGGPIENYCKFCQKCGGKVVLAAAPGGQDG